MNSHYRNLTIACLSSLLLGLISLSPAHADYDDYSGRLPAHISKDIARIHRDERNLEVLEDQKEEARRCHDYDEAKDIDIRIRSLRRLISDEKKDVKRDIDKLRREERAHNYEGSYRSEGNYRSDNSHFEIDYSDDHRGSHSSVHVYAPKSNGRSASAPSRRNRDDQNIDRRGDRNSRSTENETRDSRRNGGEYRNRDDN